VGGGPLDLRDASGRPVIAETPTWLRLSAKDGAIEVRGSRVPPVSTLLIRSATGGAVRVNTRDYPGLVEVSRAGEGLLVVNQLPLEEYLVGTVQAEAGAHAPLPMLEAQAIVARTYAVYHWRLNAAKPYHIGASTAHQQYFGRVSAQSPVRHAVRETEGRVLLWAGELFPAFYHTDSGGHTEDPREVFATSKMPALKPVRVEFDSDSPHHLWQLAVPLSDLATMLAKGGVTVGRIVGVEVLERSVSLRVARIAVRGTQGSAVLRGNEFRRLVGYDTLKSTLFAVAVDADRVRFAGRGYGHGVGMDQSSARTMAQLGYSADQILAYYYPGATFGVLSYR
jgi:stage II sporulation protein D (peptidoglycan lytic transglycosylase)